MPCFSWACLQAQGAGGATQAVPSHPGTPPPPQGQVAGPPLPVSSSSQRTASSPAGLRWMWKLHAVPGAAAHTILGREALEDIVGR